MSAGRVILALSWLVAWVLIFALIAKRDRDCDDDVIIPTLFVGGLLMAVGFCLVVSP